MCPDPSKRAFEYTAHAGLSAEWWWSTPYSIFESIKRRDFPLLWVLCYFTRLQIAAKIYWDSLWFCFENGAQWRKDRVYWGKVPLKIILCSSTGTTVTETFPGESFACCVNQCECKSWCVHIFYVSNHIRLRRFGQRYPVFVLAFFLSNLRKLVITTKVCRHPGTLACWHSCVIHASLTCVICLIYREKISSSPRWSLTTVLSAHRRSTTSELIMCRPLTNAWSIAPSPCDVTRSYVWHVSFTCATSTHSYVRHKLYYSSEGPGLRLGQHVCGMTHS